MNLVDFPGSGARLQQGAEATKSKAPDADTSAKGEDVPDQGGFGAMVAERYDSGPALADDAAAPRSDDSGELPAVETASGSPADAVLSAKSGTSAHNLEISHRNLAHLWPHGDLAQAEEDGLRPDALGHAEKYAQAYRADSFTRDVAASLSANPALPAGTAKIIQYAEAPRIAGPVVPLAMSQFSPQTVAAGGPGWVLAPPGTDAARPDAPAIISDHLLPGMASRVQPLSPAATQGELARMSNPQGHAIDGAEAQRTDLQKLAGDQLNARAEAGPLPMLNVPPHSTIADMTPNLPLTALTPQSQHATTSGSAQFAALPHLAGFTQPEDGAAEPIPRDVDSPHVSRSEAGIVARGPTFGTGAPLAPFGQGAIAQIAAQITAARQSRFEISLSPEELGKVRISLHPTDNKLQVFIFSERPETHDLLRRHSEELMKELRMLGYSSVDMDFSDGQGSPALPGQNLPDPQGAGGDDPETGPAADIAHSRRVVLGALDLRI